MTGVDYQERSIFVQGALRASYTPHAGDSPLPSLRAGDQVDLVAQAWLPQLFGDEGAFDRRAYLRSQGIDLTATLRSPELLERIAPAKRVHRAPCLPLFATDFATLSLACFPTRPKKPIQRLCNPTF